MDKIDELKSNIDNTVVKSFAQCIDNIMSEIATLKAQISTLQEEILDQKEAFEHTDDSLQKLRTTVAAITG